MISFWTFFLGSPLKIALWAGNRLATATGLLVLWRRLRGTPHRVPQFVGWAVAINTISWLLLAGVLWWLAVR